MFRKTRLLFLFLLVASMAAAGPIPDALTPYEMIDISSGHGVASGAVGTGHVVYGFNAIGGQTLDVQVIVTRIFEGTVYTDDDSMLWIFDSSGALLANNDDYVGLQSRIPDFHVPVTGLYFAGVTTCCTSDPVYTGGVLTGWQDAGKSNIEFNLDITSDSVPNSVPEPSTFALIGLCGIALGLVRRFRK